MPPLLCFFFLFFNLSSIQSWKEKPADKTTIKPSSSFFKTKMHCHHPLVQSEVANSATKRKETGWGEKEKRSFPKYWHDAERGEQPVTILYLLISSRVFLYGETKLHRGFALPSVLETTPCPEVARKMTGIVFRGWLVGG